MPCVTRRRLQFIRHARGAGYDLLWVDAVEAVPDLGGLATFNAVMMQTHLSEAIARIEVALQRAGPELQRLNDAVERIRRMQHPIISRTGKAKGDEDG